MLFFTSHSTKITSLITSRLVTTVALEAPHSTQRIFWKGQSWLRAPAALCSQHPHTRPHLSPTSCSQSLAAQAGVTGMRPFLPNMNFLWSAMLSLADAYSEPCYDLRLFLFKPTLSFLKCQTCTKVWMLSLSTPAPSPLSFYKCFPQSISCASNPILASLAWKTHTDT